MIVADELVKRITDSNLNISSPYPLGAEQLRLSQLTFLQEKMEEENLDYQLFKQLGGTHFEKYLSIEPVKYVSALTIKEIREKVEQVVSSEESNTIKIVQLKKIESEQYKSLIQQLAYKKSQIELKNLVIVLKDLGYLTTKLGELSDELDYYTEAAVFYQYVITIVDERLCSKTENEFTEKMLTNSYQQLTYIQQLIYSAVDGVPKHAPIVQVESNGNNQLLSSLRSKVELENFQKTVDADNQAKVQMPLEEQARNILFKLRKEVPDEIVKIEFNRIQSLKANDTGAGEQQKVAQQEQETQYVTKTRKLFEKIATDMGNFLKMLYEESEAELGERPCEYAVIGLGSMALKQMTPYSDLDFAILTENECYKQSNDPKIKGYFKNLSHLVNFKIINLGESIIPTGKYDLDMNHLVHVAVHIDIGGKTPLGRKGGDRPYELIKTVDWMLHYVRNEGNKASNIDKNLPYILENVSYVHGDEKLVETYKSNVTEFLQDKNKDDSQGRLNCEIRAIKILEEGVVEIDYFQKKLVLKRRETVFKGDVDNFQPKFRHTSGRIFNVKREIYRLPDRMIYNLGQYFGIEGESCWDTVDKLASHGIISPHAAINLKNAITFSTILRLKTYAYHKAQKEDMAIFLRPDESESELQEQDQQIFYLPKEDLKEQGGLFQYYYTALPFHGRFKDFLDQYFILNDESIKTFFKNTKFYEDDSIIKGLVHYRLSQYMEAQRHLEEAFVNPENQDNLQLRHILGNIYIIFSKKNQAIQQYEYCLNISKHIFHDGPHRAIADSLHSLGYGYECNEQYDQAIKCYKESLNMNKLFFPVQAHLSITSCLNNLGTVYYKKGEYDQAIKYYEKSLKMCKERSMFCGEKKYDLPMTFSLDKLGLIYNDMEQYDRAIKYHEESLKMKKLIYKEEPYSDVAGALHNLGETCRTKRQYDHAFQYNEESLEMNKAIYKGGYHPSVATSLNYLGSGYFNKKQYDQAIKYYEKSLMINKLIYKEEYHSSTADSFNNLGVVYHANGQYDLAIKYYEKSIKTRKCIYGKDHHSVIASSLNKLGLAHCDKGQYDQAIKCYEESLKMMEGIYGKDHHPSIAACLNNLGSAYFVQAVNHISQAVQIISRFKDHPYQNTIQNSHDMFLKVKNDSLFQASFQHL